MVYYLCTQGLGTGRGMDMAKEAKEVFRTQYYENKLGIWVSLCEGTTLEQVRPYLDTPIVGNPMVRIAKYRKSGVRKIKYEYLGTVSE